VLGIRRSKIQPAGWLGKKWYRQRFDATGTSLADRVGLAKILVKIVRQRDLTARKSHLYYAGQLGQPDSFGTNRCRFRKINPFGEAGPYPVYGLCFKPPLNGVLVRTGRPTTVMIKKLEPHTPVYN
jgi:hypothetical protein